MAAQLPQDLEDYVVLHGAGSSEEAAEPLQPAAAARALQDWCQQSLGSAWSPAELPHRALLALARAARSPALHESLAAVCAPLRKLAGHLAMLAEGLVAALPGNGGISSRPQSEPHMPQQVAAQQVSWLAFWMCQLLPALDKAVSGSTPAPAGGKRPPSKQPAAKLLWLEALKACVQALETVGQALAQGSGLLSAEPGAAAGLTRLLFTMLLTMCASPSLSTGQQRGTSKKAAADVRACHQALSGLLCAHLRFTTAHILAGLQRPLQLTSQVVGMLERKGEAWSSTVTSALGQLLLAEQQQQLSPGSSSSGGGQQPGIHAFCILGQQVQQLLSKAPARPGSKGPLRAAPADAQEQACLLLQLLAAALAGLPEGAALRAKLAAVLLSCSQQGLLGNKPALRKLVLDVAAAAAAAAAAASPWAAGAAAGIGGPAQLVEAPPTAAGPPLLASAQAAAVRLMAAATRDKDATVRAKALTSLQGILPSLWQHQQQQLRDAPPQGVSAAGPSPPAGGAARYSAAPENLAHPHRYHGEQGLGNAAAAEAAGSPAAAAVAAAGSPVAALTALLPCCILDKSKSVRLKAMKLLAAILTLQPAPPALGTAAGAQGQPRSSIGGSSGDGSTQAAAAPPPPAAGAAAGSWEQLASQLAMGSFSSVCSILEARPDTLLHCPDSQAAAQELLQLLPQHMAPAQVLALATCSSQSPAAARLLLQHLAGSGLQLQQLWLQHLEETLPAAEVASAAGAMQRLRGLVSSSSSPVSPAWEGLRQRCFQALCGALSSSPAEEAAAPAPPPAAAEAPGHPAGKQGSSAGAAAAAAAPAASLLPLLQLLYVVGGVSRKAGDARGEVAILLDALAVLLAAPTCWPQRDNKQAASAAGDEAAAAAAMAGPAGAPAAAAVAAEEACGGQPQQWAAVHLLLLLFRDAIQLQEHQLAGSLYRGLVGALQQLKQGPTPTLSLAVEVLCWSCAARPAAAFALLQELQEQLGQPAGRNSTPEGPQPAGEAAGAGGGTAGQQPADVVPYLLMLKHMSCLYKYELRQFQQHVIHCNQAPSSQGGCFLPAPTCDLCSSFYGPCSAAAPAAAAAGAQGVAMGAQAADAQPSQGMAQQASQDYMAADELARAHEAACQEFITDLMQGSAPASYMPLLVQLVQGLDVPAYAKVLALDAATGYMVFSEQLAAEHVVLVAALLRDPSAPPQLRLQAMASAAALIHARPSQAACLVDHMEQLLLLQQQQHVQGSSLEGHPAVPGAGAELAVAAAGTYAELLLADKLPWSDQTCQVVVACLTAATPGSASAPKPPEQQQEQEEQGRHQGAAGGSSGIAAAAAAGSIMRHLLLEVLHAPGQQQRRLKLLLALYTSCPAAARPRLVQGFLLGQLTKKELGSEELVLPVLESLLSGSLGAEDEGAAAGAALLLGSMTASAKCLTTLLQFYEAHPRTIADYSHTTRGHLQSFVSSFSARKQPGTALTGSSDEEQPANPEGRADAGGQGTSDAAAAAAGGSRRGKAAAAAASEAAAKLQALLKPGGAGERRRQKKRSRPAAGGWSSSAPGGASSKHGPGAAGQGEAGGCGASRGGNGTAEDDDVEQYQAELEAFKQRPSEHCCFW